MSLEGEMRDALRSGRDAARNRQRISDNPWSATANTARERLLAKLWVKGHAQGNPMRGAAQTA